VVEKALSLRSYEDSDPDTWNYINWLIYPVRRWYVDFVLGNLLNMAQLIPGWNWILKLIPLALSYVNIFVL
jgi:hypothetical protein